MRSISAALIIASTLITSDSLAARHQATYPSIAKDQTRPVAAEQPSRVASDLRNDDPCTIDPAWCDGEPQMPSGACGPLCSDASCGTKFHDYVCRWASDGTNKYCATATGRICDRWSPPHGLTTCATCIQ